MASLTFLGAAGTVTGSKYLIEHEGHRVLIDCGLFQGLKELRLRNWQPLPIQASSLDAVVLTHAHLDHTGNLPTLVHQGFRGPIHMTAATADLARVMLQDSASLMLKDAEHVNRHHGRGRPPRRPPPGVAGATELPPCTCGCTHL